MLIIWITNLTKDNKLKYWLIVLLMPLSILTLTTIQPYYINIKANAINRNPNQQIITTQSPAMITSVLLPGTGNNAITTNTTTTLTTAATTNSIPSAQSVYT